MTRLDDIPIHYVACGLDMAVFFDQSTCPVGGRVIISTRTITSPDTPSSGSLLGPPTQTPTPWPDRESPLADVAGAVLVSSPSSYSGPALVCEGGTIEFLDKSFDPRFSNASQGGKRFAVTHDGDSSHIVVVFGTYSV